MQRLAKSSKFWALIFGAIGLIAAAAIGDAKVADIAKQLLGVYAVLAPVVYAIMAGLEDALSNDGQLSMEELIALIKSVLDEINAE